MLKRDSDGRIFLNNHELIAIIVDYLREKKIEDPAKPLKYPYAPPFTRKNHFNDCLNILVWSTISLLHLRLPR